MLDIGANRGDWTGEALRWSDSRDITIYAFEPTNMIRSTLMDRFVDQRAVVVLPYAISDMTGTAVLYSQGGTSGTNSLSACSGHYAESVEVTTIDRFCDERLIRALSLIKIDIEGFDYLALRGAEDMLKNGKVEIVQFEYNWRWLLNRASIRDVFVFLRDMPYRFGKLRRGRIEFYDEWHFELDRFFENNYVLVRRDSGLNRYGVTAYIDKHNSISFRR
jgi:FkbM family methyltransferase